nr:Kdo hydroxylase family protein [Tatumella saanichensis]
MEEQMQPDNLAFDDLILTLHTDSWNGAAAESTPAVSALEQGRLLSLPALGFPLSDPEYCCLREESVAPGRKNISYRADSGQLFGVAPGADEVVIRQLLQRHHHACQQLITRLLPEYKSALHTPINTLRVHPVTRWKQGNSWRKDDTRLHVDAFPSRPIQGQRILRVFTNIHPGNECREWRLGEPFSAVAQRFLPQVSAYSPLNAWLQHTLKITKSRRSRYDHLMLGIHDAMKADLDYQTNGPQRTVQFPPGSSWICFSDQTPHAAMSGQFLLEQTWLLPAAKMVNPQLSPLKILEGLTGRGLL